MPIIAVAVSGNANSAAAVIAANDAWVNRVIDTIDAARAKLLN